MADRTRLHPLRICAVMAVLLAPVLASAGPDIDTKDLRARLKAVDARATDASMMPADVFGLRTELGLVDLSKPAPMAAPTVVDPVAGPVTTPALAPVPTVLGKNGGLFSLQTSQRRAILPSTGVIGRQALITQQSVQDPIAPQPLAQFGGSGGLFALQGTVAGSSGLQAAVPTGAVGGLVPLDVTTTNFRLMLATLAQTYSGVNNLSVVTAQGDRGPVALSVRSGTVTLADLKSFSAANGFVPRADGSLTGPVVIWPDATLRLSPGDHLALARDAGAFIISMGRFEVTGAVIEVTGPKNPHEKAFAPFVTIASGGSLHMDGATVRGLGFGRTLKFAGLTVAGNPLMPTKQEVVIRNTLFEQVRGVTIAGAPRADVSGNTFQDARSNALNIVGSPHAQVRSNLFRGLAPTNAIRVDVGSDHAVVADNVFLKGKRVAVLINGGSNNVVVRDNLIWNRDGAGIKFFNTRCGLAQGNILIDNRQKGIEVRKSNGIVVRDNLIAGNRSSGIWVSAQAKGAQTTVNGNVFEGNAAGLSAATGAEIWIAGNNFKRQLPKLLDGDIAQLTNAVNRDLEGAQTLRFSQGRSDAQDSLVALCGGDI